ncbi:MAG: anaerobic ribonucleoside-triphosphate reductase activating protein [Desulfuromonas sp.]
MAIKGFQGTSLLDYPGRIASLVFFAGCNLRCPYCHNPGLVETPERYPDIALDEVVALAAQRRGFIDGVVISGGEPTLDPLLVELATELKGLGLQVKLDTNGLAPAVLERLLDQGLLDAVAVDLKTAPERYPELGAGPTAALALKQTLALLQQAPVALEYRTTCMPALVGAADIAALGPLVQGCPLWVLQQFVAEHALSPAARSSVPYLPEQMQQLAVQAAAYACQVQVRGL